MILTNFHALAAARGDGLLPEFADLLERQRAMLAAGGKVEDIARRRGDPLVQAGPNPNGSGDRPLADDVLHFPATAGDNTFQPTNAPARRNF